MAVMVTTQSLLNNAEYQSMHRFEATYNRIILLLSLFVATKKLQPLKKINNSWSLATSRLHDIIRIHDSTCCQFGLIPKHFKLLAQNCKFKLSFVRHVKKRGARILRNKLTRNNFLLLIFSIVIIINRTRQFLGYCSGDGD